MLIAKEPVRLVDDSLAGSIDSENDRVAATKASSRFHSFEFQGKIEALSRVCAVKGTFVREGPPCKDGESALEANRRITGEIDEFARA